MHSVNAFPKITFQNYNPLKNKNDHENLKLSIKVSLNRKGSKETVPRESKNMTTCLKISIHRAYTG